MPESQHPDVDLIITFRTTSLSKQQTREDARKAEQQYKRLTETLSYAGLKSVGRRGESLGHLFVFVICPPAHVEDFVRRERHSDFISGLPVNPVANTQLLSNAERIRLIHSHITSTPKDGGLGISPDAPEWDRVESIFPLHDREFNKHWIKAWKPSTTVTASIELNKIRYQFGDSIALYFAFLSSYTSFLVVMAILGLAAYFFFPPYSPVYSILLSVWSITFVEWWRIHERILSLRFGTRGSFKVEKRRVQYRPGMSWWVRELRVLASIPIIILFGGLLSALLTMIFVFEAFVTHLYQGPGKQLIAFLPTLLFVVLVPRVLGVYQAIAVALTNWENHAHKSTYTFSLTLKTFALSALVAYLGLALTAFVYVPFGEGVMCSVQDWLFNTGGFIATVRDTLNGTVTTASFSEAHHVGIWDVDRTNARAKLHPGRLRDQMFAYTVTNQVINTFTEIGLPFLLRWLDAFRKGKTTMKGLVSFGNGGDSAGVKKRVVFEDEKEKGGMEERAFLDSVREEAALPEYDLFVDYNEMVVQFGYVVLWSTIWPLAGVMAFINNIFETRGDAFKIAVHNRRAIPSRTDTIGPWLDVLTFLTWLGALTNSALVYLFSPQLFPDNTNINNDLSSFHSETLNNTDPSHIPEHLSSASGTLPNVDWDIDSSSIQQLLLKAILVSLVASHGFILLRALIRHIVDKVFWRGSGEVEEREREERNVKAKFLGGTGLELSVDLGGCSKVTADLEETDSIGFWDHDEGLEEIQRISKEA